MNFPIILKVIFIQWRSILRIKKKTRGSNQTQATRLYSQPQDSGYLVISWALEFRGPRLESNRSFFNPNHDYRVVETGYVADKAGPTAPDREYPPIVGSWLTGGAILHWPIAYEFHNSVTAQLSPFLGDQPIFEMLFYAIWLQSYVFNYSQNTYIHDHLTDGAAKIFSYHFMLQAGFEPRPFKLHLHEGRFQGNFADWVTATAASWFECNIL